jgi:hypothetical protein
MPPSSEQDPHSAKDVARGLAILIQHAKKDLSLKKEPPFLSHYRVLPGNLQTAYTLLLQGAQLVRATATKYALVGAIDTKDQGNLGTDLLRGCELVGAAAHVTMQDPNGCARALREHTQKAALAIYVATLRLVEAFHPDVIPSNKSDNKHNNDNVVIATITVASKENNVGAQKTGAVWEACDHIINKMLPKGNRNAMRREIFTWTRECNDTMEEFEELIELGPKDENNNNDEIDEADNEDDDYFDDDDGEDQYPEQEMPMARACLGLLKNSRGNMKIALETCEALGQLEQSGDNDDTCLEAILAVHQHAKKVGEGVTDLGSLMYPPLLPQSSDLKDGMLQQVAFIKEFQDYILGNLWSESFVLPAKIMDLANTLRNAAETKETDFLNALEKFKA